MKTKCITFCALMSALGVIALLLGSVIDIIDMTMAVFASLILVVCYEEMKIKALPVYFVTALLAFLIVPNKLVAIEYLLFALYPLIKSAIDRLNKIVGLVIKGVYILASSAGLCALMIFVFTPDVKTIMAILYFLCFIAIFVLFDMAHFRFTMYYRFKLRHQLRIDKFFK